MLPIPRLRRKSVADKVWRHCQRISGPTQRHQGPLLARCIREVIARTRLRHLPWFEARGSRKRSVTDTFEFTLSLGLRRREYMKELLKFHEKLLKPRREETIGIPRGP